MGARPQTMDPGSTQVVHYLAPHTFLIGALEGVPLGLTIL